MPDRTRKPTREARPTPDAIAYVAFETAIGTCAAAASPDGLVAVALPAQTEEATTRHLASVARSRAGRPIRATLETAPPLLRSAALAIRAHLAGDPRADLGAIPLDLRKLTPFRRKVYGAARDIPRGELRTYAELAATIGSAGAARAVGRAMATNPWPIVVPCHRVVAASGTLHGFSAPGGTRTKASLLSLEGVSLEGERLPAAARAGDAQIDLAFDR